MLPLTFVALALLLALPVGATPLLDTHAAQDHLPATASVTGGAASALVNPAAWATSGEVESAFWWNDRALGESGLGNWGLSIGRTLGFALQRQIARVSLDGDPSASRRVRVTDFQLGAAFGNRRSHVGLAWRWSGGDDDLLGREPAVVLGLIERPSPYLGYGASLALSTRSRARHGVLDLGVRPLGTPLLTLFGGFTLRDGETTEEGRWSAGAALRPVAGVELSANLREAPAGSTDDVRISIGLGLTFDAHGANVLQTVDEAGDRQATHYLVRVNPPHRGLHAARTLRRVTGDRRLVPISLENKTLTYRRDRYFDTRRVAWVDLLHTLDLIEADPTIGGVALNVAGLRTSGAIAWELRDRLAEMRAGGRTVVVHFDRTRFVGYYLASVADVVSMDPEGSIRLAGLASHRTYVAGTLEKIGIGFEEWRLFTHKSLLESYSRTGMSEADREQRQRIIDVIYERVRDDVSESRALAPGAFDAIVDEVVLVTPSTAETRGLVDRVGRWHDLGKWLETERGVRLAPLPADARPRPTPDERWGSPREIGLVYAVGDCAMDSGIRGRATSAYLRALASRRHTVGVVLRADSPGGQSLPSDLVSEAVGKVAASGKPVVVSQGGVAASGGYWLGANGSRILTTPLTVTGSIGVAGGWAWDDGLGGKLGMTTDGVQRGAHADLFTGLRFPFVSLPLPERNLDGAERARLYAHFEALYTRFVTHVAEGRDLEEARVREIGEGRVWMGADAVALGLCDEIGSLADAIDEAKALAGLAPGDEVVIREYPERKLLTLPWPSPRIPSFATLVRGVGGLVGLPLAATADPEASDDTGDAFDPYVRAVLEAPGEPLVVMPGHGLPDVRVGE